MDKRDDNLLHTYRIILNEYQKYRKLRALIMYIYDTFLPPHLEKRVYEEVLPELEQFNYYSARAKLKLIEHDKAIWVLKRTTGTGEK